VFKRFMRSAAIQKCLGFLLAAYMVLIKYTTRWSIQRADGIAPLIESGKGVIALTWHSRFLMLNSAWKKKWQLPRGMITAIENNACVVITPDGPRGPRQRLGGGPLRLSKMTGAPIIPCIFAVRNRIQFKSWDRFVLPLPFGRGAIIWGTPVVIPADATDRDMKKYKDQIENEMNIFLADADRGLGHDPVDPAEVSS